MLMARETSIHRSGLTMAFLLAAVASVPYAYAWWSTPAHLVYTGLMFDVSDHTQYWAWVAASRSSLFIANTLTPEPNPPIFMQPMMWALAQVQAAAGLSFPALFQVWRLAATLLLVYALIQFVRTVTPDASRARTTVALALLTSGFGWLLVVWKYVARAADVPWASELYIVEPNTFFGVLAYPYLPFTQGLLLLAMTGVLRAHLGASWRATLTAGAISLLLALVHAYDLVTLYTVVGLFTLAVAVRERRIPWRLVTAGASVVGVSGPVALYYQQLTAHDALWRAILAQYANLGVGTPRPVHLVVLMGLPLVLAIAGLFPRGVFDDRRLFAATWLAAGAALIYLPVVYQVKLLNGWQYPIAVLAAHAWHERVAPRGGRTATALLMLAVLPTTMYLFAWRFAELRRHEPPYFLHRDEVMALDWLSAHADGRDVVLADIMLGRWVPSHSRARPYLAHPAMTNHFFERRQKVEMFFGGAADDTWRRALVEREGVSLIVRTDWSATLPPLYDPRASSWIDPVFVSPHTQIFRVRHTTVDRE